MDTSQIFILLIIFLMIFYYILMRFRSNLPPGPIGLPIIGYLPFIDQKLPYKTFQKLAQKYGPIYGVHLGSVYTVVLSDAHLIREAFRKDEFTARAPLYLTHGIMGGYGIICSEGSLWRDQRRQSINWLKQLGMTKFGETRRILEKRIRIGVIEFLNTIKKDSTKSPEINPLNALQHTLGNILNDLVFGIKYRNDDSTWKYLQHLLEEGVKYIGVSGVVNFLPITRFLPTNREIIKFILDGKKQTHQIYDEIIRNCTENLKNLNGEVNLENSSILELFLVEKQRRAKNHDPTVEFFSDEQLKHLLADLFGAGVDTTLTTLRWFLLYMAKYENIQNTLRQKLTEQHNDKSRNITGDNAAAVADDDDDDNYILNLTDLENNDFLKACISETQRIRSVVPLGIPHGTVKETFIERYKIPKNTMIVPLQWAIHMNESVWQNPEEFNPFRFLTPNDEKYCKPTPQFIPFQMGKRMCLGEDLAKIFLYLYAGNIIRNFQLQLVPFENVDFNGLCGITLTPPLHSLIVRKI